jgi:hypothetical protein
VDTLRGESAKDKAEMVKAALKVSEFGMKIQNLESQLASQRKDLELQV